MKYKDTKIAVIGAGSSGLAAARLARALGADVHVVDNGSSAHLQSVSQKLAGERIKTFFGDDAFVTETGSYDLCIVSPGVSAETAIAQHFAGSGVSLIGELEFGFQNTDVPLVAITGTNGKTTTTELTAAFLSSAGLVSVPCGNYGTALCEVINSNQNYEVLTVEVSSFQLELIDTFHPEIAVWMNFAPDHLDRYDSLEAYKQAKLRIFENQTVDDIAIVNALQIPGDLVARTVTFSAFSDLADFVFHNDQILFQSQCVIDFSSSRLRGNHNAENVMAAAAVAHSKGVEFSKMQEVVSDFVPPRHRCEFVLSCEGVEFVNDSKSTNLHSLKSSLVSLRPPLILIAGGKDKGLDFGELNEIVRENCSHVVAIGETAPDLENCWSNEVSVEVAEDMDDAVRRAYARANPTQTILLSPGTSSFDMFGGYQERGDAFCEAVTRLLKEHL